MNENKKQYKYLFRQAYSDEVILEAYKNMRKNKTTRKEIQKIDANYKEYARQIKVIVMNTMPNAKHPEYAFMPPEHKVKIVKEYDKPRKIIKPTILEQWIHHIIIIILKPIFMKRFHEHSFGSIPGRGIHKGKKLLKKWKHQGYKYVLKFDIRHFYQNVQYSVLIKKLQEYIKDPLMIHLIMVCFTNFKKGLPLGYYLSQWLGNALLEDLDKELSKNHQYIRYMDDVAIPSNNKKDLHILLAKTKQILSKLRLKMKGDYQIINLEHRDIDFLGFVFKDNKVCLRKRLTKKILKCVKRIKRCIYNFKPIHIGWIRQILSYKGWIDHSNSQHFYFKYIRHYITFRKAKIIVSSYALRRKKNDCLASRRINAPARTACA